MNLPREYLTKGCSDIGAMNEIIDLAEQVIRTKQDRWTFFISGQIREEAYTNIKDLSEIKLFSEGGYKGAERHRLLIQYCSTSQTTITKEICPIKGIKIQGNFIFDNPTQEDIRCSLKSMGVKDKEIGDIWVIGDRGASVLCIPETAKRLNNAKGFIRDVQFDCEEIEISDLQLPPQRIAKELTTIEASCRIDAVASAGFGISRSKAVKQIKQGLLRLNWAIISQPSQLLTIGDKVNHETRGQLEILNIELTKRQRWRIVMRRS